MSNTSRISLTSKRASVQNRFASAAIILFQLLIALFYALSLIFAFDWLRKPFIGAFIEHTLIVNTITPSLPDTWELNKLGLPFGYQVVSINDQKLQSSRQLNELLTHYQSGDIVTLTLRAPEGNLAVHKITLQNFPYADRLAFIFVPYFIGLVYLGCSLWVFRLRRNNDAGRAYALLTASIALAVAGLFDSYTSNIFTYLWTIAIALVGGALFNLSLLFPQEFTLVNRYPFLKWLGFIPAFILSIFALPTIYNYSQPTNYLLVWRVEFIFIGLSAAIFLAVTAQRRFTSESPIVREQARLVLWGFGFALAPIAAWRLITYWNTVQFTPYLLLPLSIFPVITGYAILRYRFLNTEFIFSRAVLYTLLSILAASGYALLVSGLSLITGNVLPSSQPLLIGLMVFFLALLLHPFRTRLQQRVDAIFFRGRVVFQDRLQTFSGELTEVMDMSAIVNRLREYINQSLFPSPLHIFIYDPLSDLYIAAEDSNKPSTDLRFPANSAMVQTLSVRRDSIFLAGSDTLPTPLQTERARLALLGAQLFVPLPGRQQLVGWLALGSRLSGETYTNQDLSFLESLSDQAALAIERAQVIADLERRVREMDILTRLAQGINITLAFDDILELIYAQTNHLLPSRDFFITLHDNHNNTLYHAFYLENDERLNDHENLPIPSNQGLENEVIQSQRFLQTDDYERECRGRGILPAIHGLYAWMGVPLNAGAETIGAISLGSRYPSVFYTEQQQNLLQAIADQAAGAIVKARLLQETERRALQLGTLNEIGRGLTSTLELQPLLNLILQSATEILDCEAGSLLLLYEPTEELVFEVTVGPVAGSLVGQRLPPGTGLVGKVVESGQPLIANDARQTKDWFKEADQQTGFTTRDLLVVPIQVKDKVIGVIEVINKRDGSPFTMDEQDLLSTFTSQAAVAIENARLYTQTDDALTARVEEMSVLQRIDRELNTSLDLDRSMRITLEWAMRQSKSDAGLVGIIEDEECLLVLASQGYTTELHPYQDADRSIPKLPLELPTLQEAIQSGLPQSRNFTQSTDGNLASRKDSEDVLIEEALEDSEDLAQIQFGLKIETIVQIVIPIRREINVIGALLLESTHAATFSDEIITFLTRLSDHAAIAIHNAQLYAEVQDADVAKSDFVSLVSHELKTPMTSIRGYTDLLAGGTVGPITEIQANFLSTIRSNVERMATLVSDLADISRIEAGRLHLEFKAVSLGEIVNEVVRSAQAQIEGKEQTVHLHIPDDLPRVWGDRNRLIQILTNLVSNANKYTPERGQITISAERANNQWDAQGAPEVVHVVIQDTGYGISPEEQKKIFQKFFRSEDQNVRESPGTGLGLNITRYLVDMIGGRIWFESEPGEGTVFHFTVPITTNP